MDLRCSDCGAALVVDDSARTSRCPYCGSPSVVERPPSADRPTPSFTLPFALGEARAREVVSGWLRSHGVFRCAVCARETEPASSPAVTRTFAKILRCQGCGAALAYSAEAGWARCAFCKHTLVVEAPADPVEQAEAVMPFGVGAAEAEVALRTWLGKLGFFRPSDLANAASLDGLVAICWCGWLVEGDADVSWTADSDAGTGRADWAPHAGETRMPFRQVVVSASRGLRLEECRRLVPRYELGKLAARADGALPAGVTVEQFDVQRSAARGTVVESLEALSRERLMLEGTIPGRRFRNVRVSVLLRALRTTRVALPAYVLSYRYRGQVHRAIVHGQDAQLTFGSAPWSRVKIALTVLGVLAVVVAVVALLARAR